MLHRLHRLAVSSDRYLEGVPAAAEGPADVQAHFGRLPEWAANASESLVLFPRNEWDRQWLPFIEAWKLDRPAAIFVRYGDGFEFVITHDGSKVWCAWPPTLSFQEALGYFLGPVFGLLLRLRGRLCFHASGVVAGGEAYAFLGDSGAGKSSVAAAFLQQGHTVLGEDVVSFDREDGGWLAEPSHPVLRLWPDSAESVFGRDHAFQPISPNWEKLGLNFGLTGSGFQTEAVPLVAIFVLGERVRGATQPAFEPLRGGPAVQGLFAHASGSYLLGEQSRTLQFCQVTQLAADVPVYRVSLPEDLGRLGTIVDAIACRQNLLVPATHQQLAMSRDGDQVHVRGTQARAKVKPVRYESGQGL